jgi:tetraacyldisaccharide 4'-kinase
VILKAHKWREIVSGNRVDFKARCLLPVLRALAIIYTIVIVVRNLAYDRGIFRVKKASLPVISVGNITAGGTGKTPVVIWLCRMLARRGIKTAVLSRGYKGVGDNADEPALIGKSCPGCEIVINANRYAASIEAAGKLPANGVLLLDDGFQHRRLCRDLDILTVDATCPFGYGRLLPAGMLREPMSSLKRAGLAIITRCDIATEQQVNFALWRLVRINPELAIYKCGHKYSGIEMLNGESIPIDALAGKKCFMFCGIGNPEAFLECLISYNINVGGYEIYEDHHNYTRRDVDYLLTKAADCDIILTTEKDFVKLEGLGSPEFVKKCGATKLEIDFYDKEDELAALITEKLNR